MIEILYNRNKKVFVAREHNGNIVKESSNFNQVDIAANKAGGDVVYKTEDFPAWVKDKINGADLKELNGRIAYTESFKSVFQSVIMSLYSDTPPDERIRRVVRKMLKKKLHHLGTIYNGEEIYIIAGKQLQAKVLTFKFWKVDGVWRDSTVYYDRLNKEVRGMVDACLEEREEKKETK